MRAHGREREVRRYGTFIVQPSQYVVGIERKESSMVEHNRKQLGNRPTAAGKQKQYTIRKQLGNCPTAAYPLPLFSRGHVHKTSNTWGTLQYGIPHLLMVHMLIELRRTE